MASLWDYQTGYHPPAYTPPPPVGAPPAAAAPAVAHPAAAGANPWSLDFYPGVIAAKSEYQQYIADQASAPRPSAPSNRGYQIQLAHLAAEQPIQKERLAHANALARMGILNQMAAHGTLRSGETGFLQGEQQYAYQNQLSDLARQYQYAKESAAAAQADNAAAYAQQSAQYAWEQQRGRREAWNAVEQAYVEAWQYAMEHPELFAGIDPATVYKQIPTAPPGG
jgi:hypothetical protein